MKLLMTADTLGGVWTYAVDLCRALAPYDVEIALATMGRTPSAEQQAQIAPLDHVTLHPSNYRLCWMKDAWTDVEAAGRWLLELEQRFKPDLVHMNDLAHAALPWQAPVVQVVHSCVYSWWDAVLKQQPPEDEWQAYRKRVEQSLASADLVIAPSHAMLNSVKQQYAPPRKTSVIYNGRDFPNGVGINHSHPQSPQSPQGALPEQPFIFAAGRLWDPAKNIRALAASAHELKWPLYVAGEQADPNGGHLEIDAVHCLGFLSEAQIEPWLERASIYAAPALYEPFGLSILEAARASCALVLSDIPSLREVWGDAALYVDPHDASEIGTVLSELIGSPKRREEMAKRARWRAQRYSTAKMAADYIRHYQRLLSSTGKLPRSLRSTATASPSSGARV